MLNAETNNANQDSTFLKGFQNFVRHNPRTDTFDVVSFHSIEFWCSDATNTYKRFQMGLGMPLCCKSDQSTGNTNFASYVIKSNDLVFAFTAPYSKLAGPVQISNSPLTHYSQQEAHEFVVKHGLAVRAVGEAYS
jgi:4-hydroxyphenylpyruvate dioxygenase